MRQLTLKLWNDQGGFILSTEAMIVWTITVLGVVTGLAAVRQAAVTELVETANAVGTIDQSYSYPNIQLTNGSGSAGARSSGSAATNLNGGQPGGARYGVTSR